LSRFSSFVSFFLLQLVVSLVLWHIDKDT
jgi:hypothetical protein